jgi:hypothetical protein
MAHFGRFAAIRIYEPGGPCRENEYITTVWMYPYVIDAVETGSKIADPRFARVGHKFHHETLARGVTPVRRDGHSDCSIRRQSGKDAKM